MKTAVVISDANNFGQGRLFLRAAKQIAHYTHIWPIINWIKTGGRGYMMTEGDGLAYSYSVFQDFEYIKGCCSKVHLMNTEPAGVNLYRTASHLILVAIK